MAIPAPKNDNNNSSAPFLKVANIAKKGRTKVVLVGNVRLHESQFGEQILVDVKVGAKAFVLAVKMNSGNHTRLFSRFGKNDAKWKGPIQVERGEYLGNEFVKICD